MNELIKIVEQIKVICADCSNLKKELINKIGTVNDADLKNKEYAKKLLRKNQLLDEREATLEKIEDLSQHRKDSDLRMEQGQATIDEYNKMVASFTAYEDSVKKEQRDRETGIDKRDKAITDREANLKKTIVDDVRKALKK